MNQPSTLAIASTVLRAPETLLDADRAHVVPRLLAIGGVGAGLFGAVIGSYHGGAQLAYAAIKMPFLLTIPVLVSLSAVRGLSATMGTEADYGRLSLAGAIAIARTAILAAALGPIVWLMFSVDPSYRLAVFTLVAAVAVTGLPGLTVIAKALPQGEQRWLVGLSSLAVLGVVFAQTGWLLRPFVVRPEAPVAFLRPIDSDIATSLTETALASVGICIEEDRSRCLKLSPRIVEAASDSSYQPIEMSEYQRRNPACAPGEWSPDGQCLAHEIHEGGW